jgi:hypothetical protein
MRQELAEAVLGAPAIGAYHLVRMLKRNEFRAPEEAGAFALVLQQWVAFWILVRFSSVA